MHKEAFPRNALLLLITTSAFLGCQPRTTRIPEAHGFLHLHIVDQFGNPAHYRIASFRDRVSEKKPELAAQFRNFSIGPILWSGYDYELQPLEAGWEPKKGRLSHRAAEEWQTIVVYRGSPADEVRAPNNAGGVVTPAPPSGKPAWVVLQTLFDSYVVEQSPVKEDGTFRFYHAHHGRFLLEVFSGKDLIAVRDIELYEGGPEYLSQYYAQYPLRIDRGGR